MSSDQEIRELVCELCTQFYHLGWVTGTGGSISIRQGDKIYMTPSGVQKERIKPDELYVVDKDCKVVCQPDAKPGFRPKLSDCAPLFLHAYNQRNAGAVLHSHGVGCNLVTLLFADKSEFRITRQEMIKGIDGFGYYDELVIPIIENTAWEHELADSLGEAIAKYPKACAVLVRQHGMYVWGNSWEQAKRHGECLHYLFDVMIKAHGLGLSGLISNEAIGTKRSFSNDCDDSQKKIRGHKHVLLDIEGTLSPISFVKDVLFPYSTANVRTYLESKWDNAKTQSIVRDLAEVAQLESAKKQDPPSISSEATLDEVVTFVEWLVARDRKVGPLKTLQGLIWESGYASGDLVAQLFDDVVSNLKRLSESGVKISIYSSGSRHAQQLLFRYSNHGDIRKYLTCYFDTKVGLKVEKSSYSEIALTLGVNDPSEIVFVTDILAEANAAKAAGMDVIISVRPGNGPITESHDFPVFTNYDNLI